MARKMKSMDGNTAAAHVSYAFTEVAGIYPVSYTHLKARTKRQKKNALPGGRAFAGSADEQGNQTDDPQVKRIEHIEKVLGECGFGAAGEIGRAHV